MNQDTDRSSTPPLTRPKARKRAVDAPIAEGFHGYVQLTGRGNLALPAALRRKYRLDEPGSQIEISEREDGILELRPVVAVPADQAWFWTEAWQQGEREADADLRADRVETHDNVDEFIASFGGLV